MREKCRLPPPPPSSADASPGISSFHSRPSSLPSNLRQSERRGERREGLCIIQIGNYEAPTPPRPPRPPSRSRRSWIYKVPERECTTPFRSADNRRIIGGLYLYSSRILDGFVPFWRQFFTQKRVVFITLTIRKRDKSSTLKTMTSSESSVYRTSSLFVTWQQVRCLSAPR